MDFRYVSFKGDVEFWKKEWFTLIIYYYNVRFNYGMDDGGEIVLPPSECLSSKSANNLRSEDLADILSKWLHILEITLLCL